MAKSREVQESDASRAAREFAGTLGDVEGSSYTTHDDRTIVWAFDVRYPAFGLRRLIVAGRDGAATRLFMMVPEEEAFSGMLMAKAAIFVDEDDFLKPHALVGPPQDSLTQLEKTGVCSHFYLCNARFGAPVPTPGLAAVGLRPEEIGLSPTATLALLRARTPEGLTSLDPRRLEPWYLVFVSFIRSARRKLRLMALNGPQNIIAKETALLEKRFAGLKDAGWEPERAPLPRDVVGVLEQS